MTIPSPSTNHPDVVLVGAGIMSATLAVFLKELDPSLKIELYEVLGSAAQESSNAWNNAGTGHAALCELNYTPQKSDGSIDISKALQVNTEFDLSRQFWAYFVKKGAIKDPQSFIHPVPHFSFVRLRHLREITRICARKLTHLPHLRELFFASINLPDLSIRKPLYRRVSDSCVSRSAPSAWMIIVSFRGKIRAEARFGHRSLSKSTKDD